VREEGARGLREGVGEGGDLDGELREADHEHAGKRSV
jgi:hypothetical protein